MSFSIEPSIANAVINPQWSRWLPPVWFLGLCQSQSGDPDPAMHALAQRAVAALIASVIATLTTYLVSYRRHRTLLMEGPWSSR
jgi:hypothetical protein